MADPGVLDRAFLSVMSSLVATGQTPHYTDLARSLQCPAEEGRRMLHDLLATGFPMWFHPGTDLIASFAPFNNLPTQYRVAVEGQQKWFAQ